MVALMENPTERKGIRELIDELLTTQYLCKLFGKSELTIHLWQKHQGLPVVRIPGDRRDTIRYDRAEVMEWAKKHNKRIFTVAEMAD